MKYFISIEEVKAIVESMSMIDDGKQVLVQMGVSQLKDDKVLCCLRVTGRTDQIWTRFSATPVEDGAEMEEFITATKQFAGVLSAMVSYNKDIAIEIKEDIVAITVDGVASIPVDVIKGLYELPEITMGKTEPVLFQIFADSKDFSTFAKEGCMYADPVKGNGCENIIMQLDLKVGTMQGSSTDGFLIGRSKTLIKINQKQLTDSGEVLEKYFSGKPGESMEKLILLVPDKAFSRMLKVEEGAPQITLAADTKHLFVGAGRNVYALTLGAQLINLDNALKTFAESEVSASLELSSKDVVRAVQTIKKVGSVKTGSDKVCMHVTLQDSMLCLSADAGTVRIPLKSISDNAELDFFCYSNLFEKAVSGVASESLIMQNLSGNGPVRFLKEENSFAMIYMLKARKPASEETSEGESAREAELSE